MRRIFIYPKDVMVITGRSERYSRELIRTIKDSHAKKKHQLVTISEFCDYMGIDVEEVSSSIRL